jgi:hypothetical protein
MEAYKDLQNVSNTASFYMVYLTRNKINTCNEPLREPKTVYYKSMKMQEVQLFVNDSNQSNYKHNEIKNN